MTIKIKLGEAYFNNGFIYIRKKYQDYIGIHGSYINVFLGTWDSNPIISKINRTAQSSNSPRIMIGSDFTNWVQSNHNKGDYLSVEILNSNYPNAILIK